jgi:hypothetical protein
MGQTREQRIIKQVVGKPTTQQFTPIATDMFLPNHSGIASHPEMKGILSDETLQAVTTRGATTTNDITAKSFIKTSGTSSQFLKADGSSDSSTYLTSLSGALLLDQTTEQSVINGTPYFEEGIDVWQGTSSTHLQLGGNLPQIAFYEGATEKAKWAVVNGSITMGIPDNSETDASITFYPAVFINNESHYDGSTKPLLLVEDFYWDGDLEEYFYNDLLTINGDGFYLGYPTNVVATGKDNYKLFMGAAADASIYYDGTDFVINPKEVGSGTLKLMGGLTMNANNIILDTTTGTKIGTGTTQKLGFYNSTPIVKPSAYTQTYSTASKTNPTATAANLSTTATTQTTPYGFSTQAQGDNIATQVNKMQTDYINLQKVVNALIDDLQALGLVA